MSGQIELEVAWARIVSIANEADANVARTAFSSIIRDSHDYSCAIYDSDGQLLAQPSTVAPGHLGGMTAAMQTLKTWFPFDRLVEGDVIVTNDPWIVSGHLPDIMVTMPVFYGGRLVAFAAVLIHHQDIGGHLGTDTLEVYEEGLQIPPLKLYRAGQPNDDLFSILAQNVRLPILVVSDLKSQVASLHLTAIRIRAFMQEAGLAHLDDVAAQIYDRTEEALRRMISEVPAGVYFAERQIWPAEDIEVSLRLKLEVGNGVFSADFTGTSPQVARGVNCVMNYTNAYFMFGVMSLVAPFLPSNAGAVRALRVFAPEGCILNARRPAPVVGRIAVGQNIPELIYAALADVVPERVIAESGSLPLWWLTLSGRRKGGDPFVVGPMFSGGLGARRRIDGVSALTFPTNIMNNPVEMLETESPLIVEKRELRADSAGAGEFRGGYGQEFSVRVPDDDQAPEGHVVSFIVAGRTRSAPRGVHGGGDAALAEIRVNGEPIGLAKPWLLRPGDTISYLTAGGGGYGDPRRRDHARIAEEIASGLLSVTAARDLYGFDDRES